MKRQIVVCFAALLCAAALQPAAAVTRHDLPPGEDAQVIRVIDGDTIQVTINGRRATVRYTGVDAPEAKKGATPAQCFANDATAFNSTLVAGQVLRLEGDAQNTDRYGRLLRYAYLPDGQMVNEVLLTGGYAQVLTVPPNVKYAEQFLAAQAQGRDAVAGLWSACAPQASAPVAAPPPAPAQGGAVLRNVFYDGVVKRVESDEYAEIANVGAGPINLAGWRLNAGDAGQDFVFPAYELPPGQSCRVYTNEAHPEYGGFSFGSGQAIWNNKGECGYLYDPAGNEVSKFCY